MAVAATRPEAVASAGVSPAWLRVWAFLIAVAAIGFAALGVWQLERRAWKVDLISRVEARLAAAAMPAPGRAEWPNVTRADEYRRVSVRGEWLPEKAVRVMAVTERGSGFWLMVPLVNEAGDTFLVNRGFVAPEWRGAFDTKNKAEITGLLRVTEPDGGFLRSNDPGGARWFSRDVAAIAATQQLGATAPFFIDADASANTPGGPAGGLTVVSFRNNHLIYALTWFALSAMSVFAAVYLLRRREP